MLKFIMYSFTLSNIFYELNVLNENTFFYKPKIDETNWFSSHFLLCYFASDSLQRYSLLSSLENLNLYQPSCILCVTLSHALLLGNLTGLLYFTLLQRFLFLWWRAWTQLPHWQMMLRIQDEVTRDCLLIGCQQKMPQLKHTASAVFLW